MTDKIDTETFQDVGPLKELRVAHRALDEEIADLIANRAADQLELRRMKKRKLYLKDLITRLESAQIPDLNA